MTQTNEPQFWPVRSRKFSATRHSEIMKKAKSYFQLIGRQTKRKTYARSKYFRKRKVFFDYFWPHLFEKPPRQRHVRLAFLACGIELIENSTYQPELKKVGKSSKETLYRFYGITQDQVFVVQIKDTGKHLQCLSIFPWK